MAQPVLLKQSFLLAILTGVQAVLPALVAVASLYATIILFGRGFDPSSAAIVIVAVLCLVLIQPPREVSSHLASSRVSAVVDVTFPAGCCCWGCCWRWATSPSRSMNIREVYS